MSAQSLHCAGNIIEGRVLVSIVLPWRYRERFMLWGGAVALTCMLPGQLSDIGAFDALYGGCSAYKQIFAPINKCCPYYLLPCDG